MLVGTRNGTATLEKSGSFFLDICPREMEMCIHTKTTWMFRVALFVTTPSGEQPGHAPTGGWLTLSYPPGGHSSSKKEQMTDTQNDWDAPRRMTSSGKNQPQRSQTDCICKMFLKEWNHSNGGQTRCQRLKTGAHSSLWNGAVLSCLSHQSARDNSEQNHTHTQCMRNWWNRTSSVTWPSISLSCESVI